MAWHDTNVIPCIWHVTDGRIHVAVRDDPAISAEGDDWVAAEEAIIAAIMAAAPNLDQVIPVVPQFVPPIPAGTDSTEFLNPELFLLWGDATFEANARGQEGRAFVESLYNDGVCSECDHGRGGRTTVPLRIDAGESADVGYLRGCGRPNLIVSDRFADLLSAGERVKLELRPVEWAGRRRKRRYYELIATPVTPFVAIRGMDANGVQCAGCGYRAFNVLDPALNEPPLRVSQFVTRPRLPEHTAELFAVGDEHGWNLCASPVRRKQLLEAAGSRGLASVRLGVTSLELSDPAPKLARRGMRKDCASCSRWPEPLDIAGARRVCFYGSELNWTRRNWTWIEPALEEGEIILSRRTHPLSEIVGGMNSSRKSKPAIISFRCPACWRLGYVMRTAQALSFSWF